MCSCIAELKFNYNSKELKVTIHDKQKEGGKSGIKPHHDGDKENRRTYTSGGETETGRSGGSGFDKTQ